MKSGTFLALAAVLALSACTTGATFSAPETSSTNNGRNVEPVTGISKDALVGVIYMSGERFFGVFYSPTKIDAAQKAAAPARLCASKNLKVGKIEDMKLEHPDELPGVMKLIVRCK